MDSRAVVSMDKGIKVLLEDPCPSGVPEILTVAPLDIVRLLEARGVECASAAAGLGLVRSKRGWCVPGPPKWPIEWTLYCLYSLFYFGILCHYFGLFWRFRKA